MPTLSSPQPTGEPGDSPWHTGPGALSSPAGRTERLNSTAQTLECRKPGRQDTDPWETRQFRDQSIVQVQIQNIVIHNPRSYRKLFQSPSFYLHHSCSSGPSSLPCLCLIVEETALKPPTSAVCLQPLWEPGKSLFRPYKAVTGSLRQVAIPKPLLNLFHHQMAMN